MASPGVPLPAKQTRLTRTLDVVIAGAAIIVASPLFGLVHAAVWLSSPGPAVFAQERVGRSGQTFKCLKFRTMYEGADDRLAELLATDPEARREWLADHKLKTDPRVTPLGRTLRRLNLDELPQLINVLRGEMSIVGPRPVVPTEAVRYGDALPAVLSVNPGLTGLWQVSGRNDLPYHERVALDVSYVNNRSTIGDLKIIMKTLVAMLSERGNGNGAY